MIEYDFLMPREKEIYKLREQGLTYKAIGERFNLSKNRIWQIDRVIKRKIKRRILTKEICNECIYKIKSS